MNPSNLKVRLILMQINIIYKLVFDSTIIFTDYCFLRLIIEINYKLKKHNSHLR